MLIYKVEKPIWEGTDIINISIRESELLKALRNHEPVKIIWGNRIAYRDPRELLKGTLIEKIFRFPDRPMRLRQNSITFEKPKTEEEEMREFSKQCL